MNQLGLTEILLIAAVLLGVVVLLLATVLRRRRGPRRQPVPSASVAAPNDPSAPAKRAAVIVNPTKFDDVSEVRRQITAICRELGWADPLWIETTEEDPGTGQATQALAEKVDLVCPLGGDGTVRAVAAAMVGRDVPLGLLPGGTGNLLARNLDLPVESLEGCLRIALTGRDRRVDSGSINVVVPGGTQDAAKDYVFLVMAGVGFDATVIAEAPEQLKARMGAGAYVVSGMRNLYGPRFAVDLELDGKPAFHRRVRSVIVGNCGRLQGGLELLPDAVIDDGWVDVVLLSPKGIIGWAAVLARVATKKRRGHERIDHHRCRSMVMRLRHAEEVELDGDLIGKAMILTVSVVPGGLVVRVA